MRVLLLMFLGSWPAAASILSIGSAATTPESGKFWAAGPWAEAGPFLTVQGNPAQEPTAVQMAFDDTYLYIRGRAQSFALNPSSNQRDSFLAAISSRDGSVTSDDSVEFRFEVTTAGETTTYYAAINALGTVQDMKQTPDGWDVRWNGVVHPAGQIEDGHWTFEFAIPWREMRISPRDPETAIQMNIVRFDRHHDEISSWVFLEDGDIQSPSARGQLRLDPSAALFEMEELVRPVSSSQPVEWTIVTSGTTPLWWKSELISNQAMIATLSGEAVSSKDPVAVKVPAQTRPAAMAPRARISWIQGDRTIHQTSLLPLRDDSENLEISLSTETPVTLFLNGKTLKKGGPGPISATLPLEEGANVVAIEVNAGEPLSVTIADAQGWQLSDNSGWRTAKAGTPENLTIVVNDAALPKAVVRPAGDGPARVEAFGEGKMILRRTILHRYTDFHRKGPANQWQLAENGTTLLRWEGETYTSHAYPHPLHDFKLFVALPEEIELVGASGGVSTQIDGRPVGVSQAAQEAGYTWKQQGTLQRNGQAFNCYEISRAKPVVPASRETDGWLDRQYRMKEGVTLGLRPKAGSASLTGSAYVWMEADSASVSEYPQKIGWAVAPAVRGQAPSRLTFALTARDGYVQDNQLAKAYFQTVADAGVNFVFGETSLPDLPAMGLQQAYFFELVTANNHNANSTTPLMDKLFENIPEARAVGFDGTPQDTPCLIHLAHKDEAWPFIEKAVQDAKTRNPSLTHFFWDYEYSPFPGHHPIYPGFSKFGLAEFSRRYQLPADLTPAEIRDKYAKQWIDFTAEAIAEVMKKLKDLSHRTGLKLAVYSGYYLPYTLENYNIDWSKISQAGGVDAAFCGYTSNGQIIQDTQTVLGSTPLIGALLLMGDTFQAHTPAQIMTKLIQHPAGVLFWYESGSDARTLAAIAEVSRFASEYESYFVDGHAQPSLLEEQDPQISVREKDGSFLVIAVNDISSSAIQRKITIPPGLTALSPSGGTKVEEGKILFDVLPGKFETVVLSKNQTNQPR